ncbi:MAG: hypothetical protein KAJ58_02000 [Candidatus Pacebacteria bacterium]|nr:hypothetical protein [Candidatus Paceibacterota bacterium]
MEIIDRTDFVMEVDTSEEAFESLPQTFLQKYRSGDEVFVGIGMFRIAGVGPSRGRPAIKVIYGYFGDEKKASYFYLPSGRI